MASLWGKWLSEKKIPTDKEVAVKALKGMLKNVQHVSGTIDIWADRRMRGYMGITVHWMNERDFTLEQACLDITRIKGKSQQ